MSKFSVTALKPKWPETKVQDVFSLHPKVQHAIASAIAANIGYELVVTPQLDLDERGNEAIVHAWQDAVASKGGLA